MSNRTEFKCTRVDTSNLILCAFIFLANGKFCFDCLLENFVFTAFTTNQCPYRNHRFVLVSQLNFNLTTRNNEIVIVLIESSIHILSSNKAFNNCIVFVSLRSYIPSAKKSPFSLKLGRLCDGIPCSSQLIFLVCLSSFPRPISRLLLFLYLRRMCY